MVNKLRKEIGIFMKNLANEAKETQEAASIILKHAKGEKITPEEEKALKEQFFDVLKMAGIGIPFCLIPGASVLLPLMISFAQKNGMEILPSSFSEKTEKTKETNETNN